MKYIKEKWYILFAIYAILTFSLAILGISQEQNDNVIAINDGWTLYVNDSLIDDNFNTANDKFDMLKEGDTIVLTKKLPDFNYKDAALQLYSNYTTIETYIDNIKIYEFGLSEYKNNIMLLDGYKWIKLDDAQNKTITFKMTATENNTMSHLSEMKIGEKTNLISNFIRNNLLALIVSGFLLFLGFVMLIIFVKLKELTTETKKIFFICVFSLLIGSWIVTGEGLALLFMKNGFLIKAIEYISIYSAPVPVFGYLLQLKNEKTKESLLNKKILIGAILIHTTFNLICFALHFLNIVHIRQTLTIFQLLLITSTLSIVINFAFNLKDDKDYSRNMIYGILVMLGTIIIDVFMYNVRIFGLDIGKFISKNTTIIGATILLITLMYEFYIKILDTIKQSSQMEIYNKLAFTDILTNLKNRTWYEDYIKNLDNKNYTMISIDLNDLKITNDTKGHDKGDELITTFANILSESFDIDAHSIRFGGDEFLVILEYVDNLKMEAAIQKMHKKIKETNEIKEDITVSASYGIAYGTENSLTCPTEVYKKADQRMYKMKKRIKSEQQSK